MKKCSECGSEVSEDDVYCPTCGAAIKGKKEVAPIPSSQPISTTAATPTPGLPVLIERNYWIWFLLTFLVGVFSYIYLYFNFEDLNKLDQYSRPQEVPSTKVDINNLLIWGIIAILCFPPLMLYITYTKFEKLHNYIAVHPQKQQTIPVSGKQMIKIYIIYLAIVFVGVILVVLGNTLFYSLPDAILWIFYGIGYVILSVAAIGFMIYTLIQNAKWQQAYNERAHIVCPGTVKKDLF